MYGSIPINEYVANYESILENKPFKYGDMKNRVLNKGKFFNDYSDYEILLRDRIPAKYWKYFDDPVNAENVEMGRSGSVGLNLSPVKQNELLDLGIKETQKENDNNYSSNSNNHSSYDNTFQTKDKIAKGRSLYSHMNSNGDDDYVLDLGHLNHSQNSKTAPSDKNDVFTPVKSNTKSSHQPKNVPTFEDIFEFDGNLGVDELFEKTFKILNSNSVIDNDGKKLNKMITLLITSMKNLQQEKKSLKNNLDDSKVIIKDLNKLIDNYRIKLSQYYKENQNLKKLLKAQEGKLMESVEEAPGSMTSDPHFQHHHLDEPDSNDIDSIDKKIRLLQLKKENIIKKSQTLSEPLQSIDTDKLSDDIAEKLKTQLLDHITSKNKSVGKSKSAHEDCPFCLTPGGDGDEHANLLSKLLSSTTSSPVNQDQIIELLAERIKAKLSDNVGNEGMPDIW